MKQPVGTSLSQHMLCRQQLRKSMLMPCMAVPECSAQETQSWVRCQITSMPTTAAQSKPQYRRYHSSSSSSSSSRKQACPAVVGASAAAAAVAAAAQTALLTVWFPSVWAWQAQLRRQLLLPLMLSLQLLLLMVKMAVTSCSSCLKGAVGKLPAAAMQAAPVVRSSWQQLTCGRC
jgi:hypothetical protein